MNKFTDEINEIIERAAADGRREQDERMTVLNGPGQHACDHGVSFDEDEYRSFCKQNSDSNDQVTFIRKRWPRLDGRCPKGCGYVGIYYASFMHYIAGDY